MKSNLSNMMSLDFYLSSLDDAEYKKVMPLINTVNIVKIPILSWDIHREYCFDNLQQERDIKHLNKLAAKFKWKSDIKKILNSNTYEALVLTDRDQKIIWLNSGFQKMTGYTQNEVLNKKPSFLQGEATLVSTKERIKEKLKKQQPFKEVIINYKKDKTPYKCELHIYPLHAGKVAHFLALEKQIV